MASLDPNLAHQVLNDLSRVAREDKVLTLVCIHHLDLAREFCDRIIGIAQGRVAFDGPAAKFSADVVDRVYGINRSRPAESAPVPQVA